MSLATWLSGGSVGLFLLFGLAAVVGVLVLGSYVDFLNFGVFLLG